MPLARKQKAVRQQVAERAGHCCEYCRISSKVSTSAFEVEHIVPTAQAGVDDVSNLAWSCRRCNSIKGIGTTGTDTQSNAPVSLFNPRQDVWADHFEWNAQNDTRVVGKTPTGRATVSQL